jgi:anti-sigma-K factor RskA
MTTPTTPVTDSDVAALAADEKHETAKTVTVPDHVKEWVDRSHETWKTDPGWRHVDVSSPEAANALVAQAKTYSKQRSTPVTFAVKGVFSHVREDGTEVSRLIYRVREAIKRPRSTSAS